MPESVIGAATLDATVERILAVCERAGQAAQLREQQMRSDPEVAIKQARGEASALKSALGRARVPDAYQDVTWDLVRSPAVRDVSLSIRARTRSPADSELADPRTNGHGVLLLGPVGTGKSSAASLIVIEAIKQGRSTMWSYVPDLVDELLHNVERRRQEMLRQTQANLVVWDDFGARELADWEIGHLDQIVERRYRARKPMVVTTNLTTADLRNDQRLSRIVDRWRQRTCSSMIVLNGESMRVSGGGN